MYFIQEGVTDIIKWNGQGLTAVSDRTYFGDLYVYQDSIQLFFLFIR